MDDEQKKIDALMLLGNINKGAERSITDWVIKAEANNVSELFLQISSPGGNLESTFCIYDCLRSSNIPITTYSMGNVESAAVLIYLAGDKRLVTPASVFMVHALGHSLDGMITTHTLPSFIEGLTRNIDRYGSIFKERTNFNKNIFDIDECLCGGEKYFSAADAFTMGISTVAPAEYKVPQGATWRHLA